ncbi:MerR family transcriptional regulator [Streptococcus suis]|nr:MerR family transcriptional regulator [Streptococcus suis]NQN52209.1 MerR family transcriptional regulator [Streptococcus suis]NQN90907.1 MerR family transcriptional regulator [Streptococcus suis]HEM3177751.1 MerR family transcriptional regulator [Streptococcus suis]
MAEKQLFSIGRAAKMSGVSTKTLRYYESLDLIYPTYISDESGYRYYDKETLLLIPLIKYYQQVGLNLKRIKELVSKSGSSNHYHYLKTRRDEITAERDALFISLTSIDDWLQLIIEGEMCLQERTHLSEGEKIITVKYYTEQTSFCYLEQAYHYHFKESIINLEWINYLESHHLEVSGPVILKYSSFLEKSRGECKKATILQHCLPESSNLSTFGGFMALSSYHIGPLETISNTYDSMIEYAEQHKYELKPESYERHVIDYWVTQNSDEFVTEIIIPTVTKEEISHHL